MQPFLTILEATTLVGMMNAVNDGASTHVALPAEVQSSSGFEVVICEMRYTQFNQSIRVVHGNPSASEDDPAHLARTKDAIFKLRTECFLFGDSFDSDC